MSLKDLKVPSRDVSVGDTTLTIYPITISNFADLMQDHSKELESVFSGEKSWHDVTRHAPDLAAQIIALACHEPGEKDKVRESIGLAVQLDLLRQITELTIPDQDQFADFFRVVILSVPRLVDALELGSKAPVKTPPKKPKGKAGSKS